MKTNLKINGVVIFVFFLAIVSCKKESSIEDLGNMVVNSIKTKDAEQYYSLFPNSAQVAKYGIFAYGLYASTKEDLAFWLRPYSQYSSSIDSLEKVTKPSTINQINRMFDDFRTTISWDSIEIVKIDTLNTRIGKIRNIKDKESVKQIEANMNIQLKFRNKKYIIICRDVLYIEGERWFLRNAAAGVKLEEEK